MSTTRTLTRLPVRFEQTTVHTARLQTYLFRLPRYLQAGVEQGLCEEACYYLAYTDGVEFWLRRYLAGHPTTLHRLFHEIRAFLSHDETAARQMIPIALNAVADTLLLHEWFELMKPYNKARKRIEKTFQL